MAPIHLRAARILSSRRSSNRRRIRFASSWVGFVFMISLPAVSAVARTAKMSRSAVRAARLARLDQFDTPFAAAAGPSAPRLLERHQKSEGWIFELKVSQHVPMLPHIAVQILEHVSQADDATGRNGGARRECSECDQPHDHSAGQRRGAALQKLMNHAIA